MLVTSVAVLCSKKRNNMYTLSCRHCNDVHVYVVRAVIVMTRMCFQINIPHYIPDIWLLLF